MPPIADSAGGANGSRPGHDLIIGQILGSQLVDDSERKHRAALGPPRPADRELDGERPVVLRTAGSQVALDPGPLDSPQHDILTVAGSWMNDLERRGRSGFCALMMGGT